ncbi:ATP-binding protein [Planobispora siamensis]|uniref:ATP-binding protein n=1 Tax=Planobispora siamensis TaxID=936338 RepID=A0A8J3SHA1_9ACTN|nr:ATP-binding protein [Planobispora siamensis]
MVTVSAVLLTAGLVGFFLADPLRVPEEVLEVLDKRASVISMFVGIAGLLVAGAALLAQLRRSPPGGPASGDGARAIPGRDANGAGAIAGRSPDSPAAVAAPAAFPALRPRLPAVASVSAAGTIGLPRLPSPVFTGRREQLRLLERAGAGTIGQGGPRQSGARQSGAGQSGAAQGVVAQVVVGLGGVGKSELVLHHAHRHREDYRLVWWIDAESPESIQAGLAGLCRALCAATASAAAVQAPAEEAAAWALTWLASCGSWLLVFDNVEDAGHLHPILGRLRAGHVLVTSRRDIGWEELGPVLRLAPLSRGDAVRLLLRTAGPAASADRAAAGELAAELGELPLALKQAGAYIAATPGMDAARYLRLLRTTPQRALAAGSPRRGDEVVARTWAVTEARVERANPLATRLLRLMACYAPDHLPCDVLYGLPDADEAAVAEALGMLASYSMISRSPDGLRVGVHRLVQAVVLADLPEHERAAARETAARLLRDALPPDPQHPGSWAAYAGLLPHARAVLAPDSPGMGAVLDYLRASGGHRTARTLQERRCAVLLGALGPEHPDALTARADLAYFTGESGDAVAARDGFAELVPAYERILGPDHPETLVAGAALARFTGEAGDARTAVERYTALVPAYGRVLGPGHPETLRTRANLARFTGTSGDADAARDGFAELVPAYERILGPDHPDTLRARAGLARWTGAAGDPAAARDRYAELVPVHERTLGSEHPDTLRARAELGYWTGVAGDPAAARDHFAALVPVRERVLGPEHPDTLRARANLARWTGVAGDPAAARDHFAALVPVRERVLGPEHPDTLRARAGLARWSGEAGGVADPPV